MYDAESGAGRTQRMIFGRSVQGTGAHFEAVGRSPARSIIHQRQSRRATSLPCIHARRRSLSVCMLLLLRAVVTAQATTTTTTTTDRMHACSLYSLLAR